jgi:hypothetical protein
MIEPVLKEIANKLKKEVMSDESLTATQRMREFQRWGGLMKEQGIKKLMHEERQNVVREMDFEI